jgi:hypothetical protein
MDSRQFSNEAYNVSDTPFIISKTTLFTENLFLFL